MKRSILCLSLGLIAAAGFAAGPVPVQYPYPHVQIWRRQPNRMPTPAQLFRQIDGLMNKGLATLQPIDSHEIAQGFDLWHSIAEQLPPSDTEPFAECFDTLEDVYPLILEASEAWAEFSQTRLALSPNRMLLVKNVIDSDIREASNGLQYAESCFQAAAQRPKTARIDPPR